MDVLLLRILFIELVYDCPFLNIINEAYIASGKCVCLFVIYWTYLFFSNWEFVIESPRVYFESPLLLFIVLSSCNLYLHSSLPSVFSSLALFSTIFCLHYSSNTVDTCSTRPTIEHALMGKKL